MLLASVAFAAELAAGDIVFHRSHSRQSEAIARATHSELTHVGVVLPHDGRLMVLEAVEPVGWAELKEWTARGEGTKSRRLPGLSEATVVKLARLGNGWVGRHYDAAFGWSDDRLYCSELVYKLFDRAAGVKIGAPHRLGDFDLTDALVAATLRERYGANVPLDEPVISPADLYAALRE